MRGSIRKRDSGSWELRVSMGRDPITGKYVYVSRTALGTKRDAERALAQLVTDLGDGTPSPKGVTVSELVEKHLERLDGSPTTLRGYRQVFERHIRPTIGRHRIADVGPAMLEQLYEHLATESGLAPGSIRQVHAVLRGAFSRAVKWKWLATNPARDATAPKVVRKDIVLPTSEGIAAAVVAADRRDPAFGVFVRLAAATGARRGELCALQWRAIDLDRAAVSIETSAVTTPGGGVLIKDTKNHSRRRVAIDAATIAALREHRARVDERAALAGAVVAGEGFVFSHEPDAHQPWYVDNVSHNWDRVRREVGLDGVRLHDLRHFQATQLLQAGIAVPTVAKRIGHRDSATTLNVYSHFIEEADAKSADVMARVLDGPPAPGKSSGGRRIIRTPRRA
jgi:integrase